MNFFDIKSVSIVGASQTQGKIGNSLVKKLSKFKGKVFGVNPKGGSYKNIVFYKSIESLPMVTDIAVIAIKADYVPLALEQLGQKGVKRAIVISAGFKEVGNIALENRLKQISKKYNIQLLGPNCLGYYDICNNLDLSFGGEGLSCGKVAMISQSGAMAVALSDWAISKKLGISKIISMGNKAGIDENQLLLMLKKDEKTKVIAMYLESIETGEDFIKIAQKVSKIKPIVLIKSGISNRGMKAASSHTGALSSEKKILKTAFFQSGVHSTHSVEDFFLWSHMFSSIQNEEIPQELVIITNAGGPGVMATDHCEFNKVVLSDFSKEEKAILKKGLSDASSVSNPIDIIGDATSKSYKTILNNLSKLKKKRAILVILTAQSVTDVENIAHKIIDFKNKNPSQLLFVSFMGGSQVENARKILQKSGILEYDYPKKAIIAYRELLKQKSWQDQKIKEKITKIKVPKEKIEKLKVELKKEKQLVSPKLLSNILKTYNINYIEEKIAKDISQIENIYKDLNANKLVARIVSPDIAHKSDIGGVILNISSLAEAKKAYKNILQNAEKNAPRARVNGVSFSKMALIDENAKEIFVGFKRDKSFGRVMIVGIGGIYVNILEDIRLRIGDVSKKEIMQMLKNLKLFDILNGARGRKKINFKDLVENIYKLQFIFKDFEEIKEIDINPIIASDKEALIIDAKFYL